MTIVTSVTHVTSVCITRIIIWYVAARLATIIGAAIAEPVFLIQLQQSFILIQLEGKL
jgi:hypothetical protein